MLQVSSIYKGQKSAEKYTLCMFLEVKRIKRISGLRHLYYCTRSEVKLHIARKNGYAKQNIILLHFLANKPHGELSGITKKKKPFAPRVLSVRINIMDEPSKTKHSSKSSHSFIYSL